MVIKNQKLNKNPHSNNKKTPLKIMQVITLSHFLAN